MLGWLLRRSWIEGVNMFSFCVMVFFLLFFLLTWYFSDGVLGRWFYLCIACDHGRFVWCSLFGIWVLEKIIPQFLHKSTKPSIYFTKM